MMLELVELLLGVGVAVAVMAGGWLAVSLILKNSGTGTDAMTEMLNADATPAQNTGDRILQEVV